MCEMGIIPEIRWHIHFQEYIKNCKINEESGNIDILKYYALSI